MERIDGGEEQFRKRSPKSEANLLPEVGIFRHNKPPVGGSKPVLRISDPVTQSNSGLIG
jgi:hypothetical protein